ncbi:MAG: RNA polymerase sigma factor [Labilithrix sp.]|nr:RNA polymerase sigma factor [Labilithrix sp.]
MDPPSFRFLFETEFSYVWNTLRRLGVPERDVLDQAQEVFVVVHGLLPDYDASRPVRPWLFAIAYRVACRYRSLSRNKHELPSEDVPEEIDPAPLGDEKIEADEARALMLEAIEAIDLPRRGVFILAELEEQPVPEVAKALQIPLNTAYSRLRLAREDFEKAATRLLARRRTAKRAADPDRSERQVQR